MKNRLSAVSITALAMLVCVGIANATIYVDVTTPTNGGNDANKYTEVVNGIEWTYTISCGEASVGSGGYWDNQAVPITTSGSLTIPSSLGGYPVTNIGREAFNNCRNLTSVTIPDSVTNIGNSAFSNCGGLRSVIIGKGVTHIMDWAFHYCTGLTSVMIPDSVTSIGGGAFYGCSGLASVMIPDSVTSIGSCAFRACTCLTFVMIPNSVTSIGEHLFYDCDGLTTAYVPESIKGLVEEHHVFYYCNNVTVQYYNTIDDLVFAIIFNANGGKGKMATQTMTYGTATKLRKNTFTRNGYVFLGWATRKGGVVKYKNAQSVKNLLTDGGTTTLYAVWAKKTYKVAFYANGGKLPKGKKMSPQKMTYGKAKKLSANKFKRKGYTFKGWAKSKALAKKGTVTYKNKAKVKNLVTTGKTVKLYAVWKKK